MNIKNINPGDFNKRIDLAKQNSDGTYTVLANAWANIRTLSATQLIQAKAVNIAYTDEMIIRYRVIPSEASTIIFTGRYFNIETIINIDEQNKLLRILCNEVV